VTDYRALLAAIAVPRLTGTSPNLAIREVLKRELSARGFVVMEHRFTGRSLLHRFARAPLEGVNLIAVRPRARVTTWLVAHYDSKGQPLSMATRLVAAALATLGALELLFLALRALLGSLHGGVVDVLLGGSGIAGIALLAAARVTNRSAGAVDNAAGVVAALATVDALPPEAGVGVLLPDAEEYGLLGARALVRERANLLGDTSIVNFDGVDDRGRTIAFMHRGGPTVDRVAAALGARRARWLPVLVDGLMLTRAAREGVTIMRGDWRTATIVHTPRDSAERLTLEGVRLVAEGVARGLAEV
jgi:peptidase M28-like protein